MLLAHVAVHVRLAPSQMASRPVQERLGLPRPHSMWRTAPRAAQSWNPSLSTPPKAGANDDGKGWELGTRCAQANGAGSKRKVVPQTIHC